MLIWYVPISTFCYQTDDKIQPLEILDFNNFTDVLFALDTLACLINRWYASDDGYEADEEDNA